jgi:hypothetical protein
MICVSVCANAQTHTLAVYYSPASAIDSTTMDSLQQELQRVLLPAGIQLLWPTGPEDKTKESERLVVGSFDGNCSAGELPLLKPIGIPKDTLADTLVSRRGRVLPFFHVDCTSVVRTLRPVLDHVSMPMRDAILGRALARVIAHEIYHILAQSTDHAESGVAKPQFSLRDLMAERLDFNLLSLVRMPTIPPTFPDGDLATQTEEVSTVAIQSEIQHTLR